MVTPKRVAIVDDEAETAQFLASIIADMGHRSQQFGNGEAILKQLNRETYDLLLLDWNMPGRSGMEVLEWVRTNMNPAPPTILITSRSDKVDVAAALDAGADDYIIKPESAEVIRARVRAVMRRAAPDVPDERILRYGRYAFDKLQGSVEVEGTVTPLTSKEFALALMFFKNCNRPVSRGYILETVWNSVGDVPTRTLDMHVSRIRAKLSLKPENGFRLSTIFGYGYRLENYGEGEDEGA